MAVVGQPKVNGAAAPFQAFGREIEILSFTAAGAMSQADLDALVEEVQSQNVSVTAIGDFTADSSTSVNMIVEGHSAVVAAGYTVASVAF